jgi:hypothetical protein
MVDERPWVAAHAAELPRLVRRGALHVCELRDVPAYVLTLGIVPSGL